MPRSLPNTTTQDAYANAVTLGPIPGAVAVDVLIANQSVDMEVAAGAYGDQDWTYELQGLTPTQFTIPGACGVRFKSHVAGSPAQVAATAWFPGDARPEGATPYTQLVSPTGGISPAPANVEIDVGGALVGTEPKLNLIAGLASAISGVDVPASSRVDVTIAHAALADVTVGGGGAASISFSAIPATYRHLLLVTSLRGDAVATAVNVLLRLNGDAGANYAYQNIWAYNGNNLQGQNAAVSNVYLGDAPAASATAGMFEACLIFLANYTATSRLAGAALQYSPATTAGPNGQAGVFGIDYNGGAAISSITLSPSSGNWVSGSRATLYGLP